MMSCSQQEKAKSDVMKTDAFFDLHSYVEDMIVRYNDQGIRVNKKVSLNDKSELLENFEVDWNTEFQPLLQAHINRSAWVDKFSVDTLKNTDGIVVIYRSDDFSIPVRELQISFNQASDVQSIKIETGRKNILYRSKQVIELEPDIRYTVDGNQRALFLSKTAFKIDSYILTKEGKDLLNQVE